MTRQERTHLPVVFFIEYRAGGVKQCTTRGQQPPERIQHNGLLRGKLSDVLGTTQPFDVRIASHHAGSAARHVSQNAIERLPVPPAFGMHGIAFDQAGMQLQPVEVFLYAQQPCRIDVERSQVHVSAFQDMAGLSAGRGASVQHPFAGLRIEQASRPLRACILYRHVARIETGQVVHRHRAVEGDCVRPSLMCGQPGLVQAPQIACHVAMAAIDAQGKRRMQQARFQDVLPTVRMLGLECVDPPVGMRPMRGWLGVGDLVQLGATALEVAQYRIRQSAPPALAGCSDRVVHHGMGRCARIGQLIQRHAQQPAQLRIGQRAFEQGCQPGVEPSQLAQAAVDDVLQCAALARRAQLLKALRQGLMQGRAGEHRFQHAGRQLLQLTHGGKGRRVLADSSGLRLLRGAADDNRRRRQAVRVICSSRATRSSVAGCVENSPANPLPDNGLMIIICAVSGCASAVGIGRPLA